jgi:hypothetical protein
MEQDTCSEQNKFLPFANTRLAPFLETEFHHKLLPARSELEAKKPV